MAVNTIRTQQTLFASLRPAGRQRQSMTLVGEVNWSLLAGRHCGGIERTRRPVQRTGQTDLSGFARIGHAAATLLRILAYLPQH